MYAHCSWCKLHTVYAFELILHMYVHCNADPGWIHTNGFTRRINKSLYIIKYSFAHTWDLRSDIDSHTGWINSR